MYGVYKFVIMGITFKQLTVSVRAPRVLFGLYPSRNAYPLDNNQNNVRREGGHHNYTLLIKNTHLNYQLYTVN